MEARGKKGGVVRFIYEMKIKGHFTAVFEEAAEGGLIVYIEEMPGVNTQGKTLNGARENLEDALLLVMEVQRELAA